MDSLAGFLGLLFGVALATGVAIYRGIKKCNEQGLGKKEKLKIVAIHVLLGLAVPGLIIGFQKHVTKTYISPSVEYTATKIVGYDIIRERDKELYKMMLRRVTNSDNYPKGVSVYRKLYFEMLKVFYKWIPRSSDEAILDYVHLRLDMMDKMERESELDCISLTKPSRKMLMKVGKVTNRSDVKYSNYVMGNIFKSYDEYTYVPIMNDIRLQMEAVYRNLYKTYGDDLYVMENPLDKNNDGVLVCDIIYDLLNNIVSLPEDEAVYLLRGVFGSSGI